MVGVQEKAMVDDILNYCNTLLRSKRVSKKGSTDKTIAIAWIISHK